MDLSCVVRDNLLNGVQVTQRKLGGGGYGSVFLGTWHGARVAVKRLHATAMGIDENGRPTKAFVRFMKELPILQQLSHPSIVQVFGMVPPSSHEGSHGLVMEFLPVTLKNRYEQEPQLTNGHEVSIMASLASGLQYLHHKGILHRDLSTSNVMLVERAGCEGVPVRAKIIDAGMARVLADVNVDEMTLTPAPGAEKYLAPEARIEIQDQKVKYGRPADVYGLGVTVMAMCNRREPPPLASVVLNGLESGLTLMKGLRHPLHGVVSKCVEEDSSVRPTCLQLCEELAKLQLRYPTALVPQRSGDGTASDGSVTYTDDDVAPLRDQLYDVTIERDALRQENQRLIEDLNRVTAEKDAATAENEKFSRSLADALVERDSISRVLDRVADDRHSITRERDQAIVACKQAVQDRNETAAERDRLGRECREAISDLNKAITHRDWLLQERDCAISIVSQLTAERDRLSEEKQQRQQSTATTTEAPPAARFREPLPIQYPKAGIRRKHSVDSSAARRIIPRRELQQVIRDSQLPPSIFPPGHPLRDRGTLARSRRLLSTSGNSHQWTAIDSPRPKGVRLAIAKPVIHNGYFYSFFAEGGSASAAWMPQRRFGSLSLFRIKVGPGMFDKAWQHVPLPPGDWSVHEDPHIFISSFDIFFILTQYDGQSSIFKLDTQSSWKQISSFPCRLLQFAIAVVDHTLLVIGGSDFPSERHLASVHSLDMRYMKWSQLDALPSTCVQPAVAVWDTSVHVFLRNETRVVSIDVRASERDRKWSYDVLPPVPSAVQCAAVVNECLVVATSKKNRHVSALMYIPECQQYLPLPECSAERADALVSLYNTLCLVECQTTGQGMIVRLFMLSESHYSVV